MNFGLRIRKVEPDLNFDEFIDQFDEFLSTHAIGATYAADADGDDHLVVCFAIAGDNEERLADVSIFADTLPAIWNPSIERLQ